MVAVLSGLRAEGLPLAKLARAAGMAAASGSSSSRRSRRGSAAGAVQLRMRGADLQQPALAPASVLTENSASWRVRSGQASVSGPHDSCTGATACNSLSVCYAHYKCSVVSAVRGRFAAAVWHSCTDLRKVLHLQLCCRQKCA